MSDRVARQPATTAGSEASNHPEEQQAETRRVEVRRSRRRRSTVSAYREGDTTIVSIPARFTLRQEREWVNTMMTRLDDKEARRRPSDDELMARAQELSQRYLGGKAVPSSVRWSNQQERRWGSCSMPEAAIRISYRVRGLPEWVIDYVLLHELAHILVFDHSEAFWDLLRNYPKTQRARGFLDGLAFAEDTARTSGEHAGHESSPS